MRELDAVKTISRILNLLSFDMASRVLYRYAKSRRMIAVVYTMADADAILQEIASTHVIPVLTELVESDFWKLELELEMSQHLEAEIRKALVKIYSAHLTKNQ